jgi:hypothetical protein
MSDVYVYEDNAGFLHFLCGGAHLTLFDAAPNCGPEMVEHIAANGIDLSDDNARPADEETDAMVGHIETEWIALGTSEGLQIFEGSMRLAGLRAFGATK